VFLGTHHPRLDDKGRLILPAKFREELASGLVVTRGEDHCLVVYSVAGWERITESLSTGQMTNKRVREFSRVLYANASDEIPDRQGRITIPPPLREYAGLDRDCAVIGANTRVEIWEPAAWERYLADTEGSVANVEEEVLPGLV